MCDGNDAETKETIVKMLSDQLDDLAQRARQTEEVAAAARDENRAALDDRREHLRATITAGQAQADAMLAAGEADTKAWWRDVRSDVEGRMEAVRSKRAEFRADHDLRRAESRADEAEIDALDAIGFAGWAIEQAEYAVIDAVLARADVEELSAAGAPAA